MIEVAASFSSGEYGGDGNRFLSIGVRSARPDEFALPGLAKGPMGSFPSVSLRIRLPRLFALWGMLKLSLEPPFGAHISQDRG